MSKITIEFDSEALSQVDCLVGTFGKNIEEVICTALSILCSIHDYDNKAKTIKIGNAIFELPRNA